MFNEIFMSSYILVIKNEMVTKNNSNLQLLVFKAVI